MKFSTKKNWNTELINFSPLEIARKYILLKF